MLRRLTGLCSRRQERPRSDIVARFCFHFERGGCWNRQRIYVCMQGDGTLGNIPPHPPPAHLWSRPSFEATFSEGRGIKAKQKSRQVHVALELTKSAICIIYSLNCSNARRWRDLWVPDNPSGLTNAIKHAPSPHLFLITACGAKTWEHLNAYEVIYLNINSGR